MTSTLRSLSFSEIRKRLRNLFSLSAYGGPAIRFLKYIPSRIQDQPLSLTWNPVASEEELPVPPRHLWLGYGNDDRDYVASGKKDMDCFQSILSSVGMDFQRSKLPILDLGCGAGRILRHFRAYAEYSEFWGMDISAPHINWLKTHLSPPFRFALNSTLPHLPFEDGYFGLIYCASVFTHIDDFTESWLLEVRRILVKGGFFLLTVHDEHTLKTLDSMPTNSLAIAVQDSKRFFSKVPTSGTFIIGTDADSQVFYSTPYLHNLLNSIFHIELAVPHALGFQTVLVLKKR